MKYKNQRKTIPSPIFSILAWNTSAENMSLSLVLIKNVGWPDLNLADMSLNCLNSKDLLPRLLDTVDIKALFLSYKKAFS